MISGFNAFRLSVTHSVLDFPQVSLLIILELFQNNSFHRILPIKNQK